MGVDSDSAEIRMYLRRMRMTMRLKSGNEAGWTVIIVRCRGDDVPDYMLQDVGSGTGRQLQRILDTKRYTHMSPHESS